MSEMHNILNKLQQLNESTDVTEAEKKCDDCGKPISKCECEGHDHKEEMDESKSSAIAEAVSQVEAKLLKEYAEFKEMMGALHPDNRKLGHKVNALKGQAGQMKNRLKEEPNEGNEFRDKDGNFIVKTNPKFLRPAEVDLLVGNSSKAKEKLLWYPKHSLDSLIRDMLKADLKRYGK